MRLIHCADVHLDSKMLTHLSSEQAKERNIELLNNFCKMIAYGKEYQVQGVLLSGDLFDTREVSSYIINEVLEQIASYPEITFFYVRGNHDRTVCLGLPEELPKNLILFDKSWKYMILGKVCISGIECVEDSLLEEVEKLSLDPERINIVMLHGTIMEQQGTACAEDRIPLKQFRNKNIDYMALGHIHSYQYQRLDYRGAYCYPGCLEGRGFDECGIKGFVLLDIEEENGIVYNQFIPFGKRRIWEWEVEVSGCMTSSQMARRIEQKIKSEESTFEDLVRIKLVGELDVECEKNLTFLKKKFEDSFYHISITDCTVLKVDYEDFVMDESLKGEFVRMLQAESSITEKEKIDIMRCGILALSGEELWQ